MYGSEKLGSYPPPDTVLKRYKKIGCDCRRPSWCQIKEDQAVGMVFWLLGTYEGDIIANCQAFMSISTRFAYIASKGAKHKSGLLFLNHGHANLESVIQPRADSVVTTHKLSCV